MWPVSHHQPVKCESRTPVCKLPPSGETVNDVETGPSICWGSNLGTAAAMCMDKVTLDRTVLQRGDGFKCYRIFAGSAGVVCVCVCMLCFCLWREVLVTLPLHHLTAPWWRLVWVGRWGGSAGVVNQAAEVSGTASSQHQGSSQPFPAGIHQWSARELGWNKAWSHFHSWNKCIFQSGINRHNGHEFALIFVGMLMLLKTI